MRGFLLLATYLLFSQFSFAQIINSTNFETQASGTAYTRPIWQADGFTTDTWDNGLTDRTSIVNTTSVSGTKSLRITYPVGQYGPGPNGAQIPLLFTPRNEAYMSYNLKFSDNFTWGTTSYGGKLPGLAGGDNCSGGAMCDGTNGFSCRFMWRTGGQAVLYLYHMDKPDVYGEDHELLYPNGENVIFEKGKWYHMAERVKINTNGTTYDGEVQVWVNGLEVLHLTGLRFTNNGDKIDNLYISTFHGGADATWAPTATCYTYIDDVIIGAQKSDVAYKTCIGPNLGANKTLCGTTSVTLDAGVSDVNATFNWVKNGVSIGTSKTYNATTVGEYVLIYDSLGCVRKDTVTVSNTLTPNLGTDKTICSSSFETLSAGLEGTGLSYVWKKDNVEIPNSTQSSLLIKDAGTYSVTVSASGCTTATDQIIVTSGLLTIADVAGITGENKTLTIQNTGTNYSWFSQAIGGSSIASGKIYATTIPATTTHLYAQDMDGYTGLVGKPKLLSSGTYTDNRFDRRMKFQVFRTLTIDSISVYPTATQNVTIRILASDQSTVISTITYTNLSAGEQRIKIGTQLNSGIYYMDATGTTNKLSHSYEADTDIHFPYTVNGLISILGSNLGWIDAKPYYLYFYNWRVSAGNSCARTPVLLQNTSSSASTTTQTIPLEQGWNLISTNVHPTDSSISTLFTGLQVQQIKNADIFWKLGQATELNKLQKIEAGKGYLVYMNAAGNLIVSGIPMSFSNFQIGASSNWYIIGCPFQTSTPFSTNFNATNCQTIKNFDGFWEPSGSTNSILNFEPGKGYFIKK